MRKAVPLLLRPILFLQRKKTKIKARIKASIKTFPRSATITIIKRATIPKIVSRQKRAIVLAIYKLMTTTLEVL